MRDEGGEEQAGEIDRNPATLKDWFRLPSLTLRTRLGVLSVAVAVPILLFASLFISSANQDIDVVRREIVGAAELARRGPGPFNGRAEASAAASDAALIADRSGITLDPVLNSYYLGHAVTIRQPQLMVAIAHLKTTIASTDGGVGAVLDDARADLRATVANLTDTLARAAAAQPADESVALRQASAALKAAMARHEARIAAEAPLDARQQTLGGVEAAAREAWITAHDQLEAALTERLESLRRQLALNLMIAALCVLVAAIMMVAIHGSVVRGVNRISEVVRRLMEGDTSTPIPYLDDKDEWGPLAGALLAYRTALVERTRLQDEALVAMRAKSEFLDNINHEIRTPLNGVIGVANALNQTRLDDEQRRMIELICASGRSVERLLTDVLDHSRLAAGGMQLEPAPFEPASTLRSATDLFSTIAADKGLRLELNLAYGLPAQVEGDAVRVGQIVSNLVSNAVKFTATGGVSVNARTMLHEAEADSVWLVVDVRDTGIGFDEATLPVLLDRFSQADPSISRRYGGAGLGLSTCKALLDLMGGSLSARSTPGEGSCFTVRIPLPVLAAATTPSEDATPARPLDVLLVEDHPLNRQVVQLLLEPLGVRLTMAENGAVGVDRFREGRFDLVLMDIQMPVLDGLAATASIRDLEQARGGRRTPIVMLTANVSPENRQAASQAGADGHLAKPLNHRELFNVLAAVA